MNEVIVNFLLVLLIWEASNRKQFYNCLFIQQRPAPESVNTVIMDRSCRDKWEG